MRRLMYYPATEDELIENILDNGIQPDEPFGSIYLYADKEDALRGFFATYFSEPDFIIPVLAEESELTSVTIFSNDWIPINEFCYKGVLSLDEISLNANDISLC